MTDLSVLIVNYNSWQHCVCALESLEQNPHARADGSTMSFEVLVVDNHSPIRDEASIEAVRSRLSRMNGRLILHGENSGYAAANNLAYRQSSGRWILISNPDVVYLEGCLGSLVDRLEMHADVGAVVPQGFWDESLTCRLPAAVPPTLGDLVGTTLAYLSPRFVAKYSRSRTRAARRSWEGEGLVDLEMFAGCSFLMKRQLIEEIGLFDDRFPLYYEDADLSRRIRNAGKRIVQVQDARLVHAFNGSGTTDYDLALARYRVSRGRYYRKWYGPLGGMLLGLCNGVVDSSWGRRRRKLSPHPVVKETEVVEGRPVIRLPRSSERFLVEVSLDPYFFLAGAVFGRGDSWTPKESLFARFGQTMWFRVVDLTGKRAREIGIWRFERGPEASGARDG